MLKGLYVLKKSKMMELSILTFVVMVITSTITYGLDIIIANIFKNIITFFIYLFVSFVITASARPYLTASSAVIK